MILKRYLSDFNCKIQIKMNESEVKPNPDGFVSLDQILT